MRFLDPLLLTWFAAAVVPIVFYLFRHRPQRQRVSTLLFFKALAKEYQESAWLRRLKKLLSLLLTLLILAGATAALARLVVAPRAGDVRNVVVLIDRSASMAAQDRMGQSRLDAAIRAAEQRLAALPSGVAVSVMAFDHRPEILLPRSIDQREVERTLRAIRVRPIAADSASALQFARQVGAIETPAAVWVFSDRSPAGLGADESDEVRVEPFSVALTSPVNVGISGFELRRLPMERDRLEAFVQVHAVGPADAGSIPARLEVRLDHTLIALRELSIDPGGRQRLLIPLTAGQGATLSLRVEASGDALKVDNEVLALVPPVRPVGVLWVSERADPFTELALRSLGRDTQVAVFHGGPEVWPPREPVDVAIFDGWLPEVWPADLPVIAIDPPRSLGPLQLARLTGDGLPVDGLRATDGRHAVLYGLATGRVILTQTSVMEADRARSGLEPLWVGPHGPVLAAGEVRGQRLVAMAFDPSRSQTLPLTASYPLLVGNAIYWATQPQVERFAGNNRRTGELIAAQGTSLQWSSPDTGLARAGDDAIVGSFIELDRIGLWRTNEGERGSAALLSPQETLLPAADTDAAQPVVSTGWRAWLAGDLTPLLLWIVVLTLLVESWLFHLHAVY